jgi:hypothetical protein
MFSDTVQDAPGARVEPVKLAEKDPATAVAVPPQVEIRFVGAATRSPAGRKSVNAIPLSVEFTLGLVTVKVRLVVPFTGIVATPKAFVIVGGLMTVKVAELVFPLPASVESMVTLLLRTPSLVPCTFTVIVQGPTGKAAFVKLMVPAPAVAVTEPAQPFTTLGVVATTKFAGNVSVKLALIATVFPFVMLNVRVLGAFTATVSGLKLLVIAGGCKIVMSAVTVC